MTIFEPPAEWKEIFHKVYSNNKENLPGAVKDLKTHGLTPSEIILVIKNELALSLAEAHTIYQDTVG